MKKNFIDFIKHKREGISTSLPNLDKVILKILPSTYYLIGGASNSGKTTFLDACFFLQLLPNNVKIFYYSFEINEYRKYAKLISNSLYRKSKGEISLSDMDILNMTSVDISSYMSDIEKTYHNIKEYLKDKVVFRYSPTNPTQIYKDLRAYAEEIGRFIPVMSKIDGEEKKIDELYERKPEFENQLVVVIVDHIGLSRKERGFNKKENIDKLSEYFVEFRNKCSFSFIALQQLNRGLSTTDRQKFKGDDLMPTDADFKETGNTIEDCDIGMIVFNPSKYGLNTCLGQPINRYNRAITIVKNRYGESEKTILVDFNGKVGVITEKQIIKE